MHSLYHLLVFFVCLFVPIAGQSSSGFSADTYVFSGFDSPKEEKEEADMIPLALQDQNQNDISQTQEVPIEPTPQAQEEKKTFSLEEWEEKTKSQESVESSRFGELFIKMILLLTLTCIFLFVGSWALRKFLHNRLSAQNREGRIKILEKRALSPKSQVVIVQIDTHEIALVEHANGVVVVESLKKA